MERIRSSNKDAETYWWDEAYGFFGQFYMEGDNSKEGYLTKKMNITERTLVDVQGVIKLMELKGGERILDIPCGYGRHSVELAKRGFMVVGSDINSVHLEKAKTDAEKNGQKIDFLKENMIDIKYKEEFDAVMNMCYSFGFFKNDEENIRILKKFFEALKSGGKFIMHTDVNIPRIRAGKYKEDEERILFSGNKLKITDRYNPKTKRIDGSWTIIKSDGTKKTKKYSVRVYEKDEFCLMCLEVGFKKCEVFGSWDGDPYTEDSEEIMFVATK